MRKLLEFCEDIDVAPIGVSRKLRLPTVKFENEVSDVHITSDEADKILALDTVTATSMQYRDTSHFISPDTQECSLVLLNHSTE